jgi:hypothetical protein
VLHQELTRIAAEKSPEKRLELLHKVTDLYFEGFGGHSASEAFLFNDIMEKIVDLFSSDLKRQVSASLAVLPNFPTTIVKNFAEDEDIEIARPVLRSALSLTDDDLVRLAERGSQAHLTAIAARSTLPEKVTDVLIDRGDRGVVHVVTANHGARFSDHGMDRLLDKAEDDINLRELLVDRPDLSPRTVEKLLPLISESLMLRLAERGYDLDGAVSPEMANSLRQRLTAALRTRKDDVLQVSMIVEQVRGGKVTLDDAVRQIADAGRLLDVSTILSTFARLEQDHVFNLIYRGQLQTVLILSRSLELSWPTVDALLAVRAVKQRTTYFNDPAVRRDYEAIDLAIAQRTIRFLRVRQVATAQAGQAGAQVQAGAA